MFFEFVKWETTKYFLPIYFRLWKFLSCWFIAEGDCLLRATIRNASIRPWIYFLKIQPKFKWMFMTRVLRHKVVKRMVSYTWVLFFLIIFLISASWIVSFRISLQKLIFLFSHITPYCQITSFIQMIENYKQNSCVEHVWTHLEAFKCFSKSSNNSKLLF